MTSMMTFCLIEQSGTSVSAAPSVAIDACKVVITFTSTTNRQCGGGFKRTLAGPDRPQFTAPSLELGPLCPHLSSTYRGKMDFVSLLYCKMLPAYSSEHVFHSLALAYCIKSLTQVNKLVLCLDCCLDDENTSQLYQAALRH